MINLSNFNPLDYSCLAQSVSGFPESPLATLKSFFDYQDLPTHLKRLKQWRTRVVTNDYFETSTTFNPLFEHKMMSKLLDAAYLLHQTAEQQTHFVKDLSLAAQQKYIDHERDTSDGYPKHLDMLESIDPYLGLESVFEYFTLQQYHDHLYDWLDCALSPNVKLDDTSLVQVIYKNLRLMMECTWLILKRQIDVDVDEKIEFVEKGDARKVAAEDAGDTVPEHVLAEFKKFLTVVPPERLNRGLRKLLVDYLFYNIEGLPLDFEEILSDFYWLTDLLDEIQGKEIAAKYK